MTDTESAVRRWLGPPPGTSAGLIYCQIPRPETDKKVICGYVTGHKGNHGAWNGEGWDEWERT